MASTIMPVFPAPVVAAVIFRVCKAHPNPDFCHSGCCHCVVGDVRTTWP